MKFTALTLTLLTLLLGLSVQSFAQTVVTRDFSSEDQLGIGGVKPLPNVTVTDSTVSASGMRLLVTSNSYRQGFIIDNKAPSPLYIAYGNTIVTTSATRVIPATTTYTETAGGIYTGVMTGQRATGTLQGDVRVTELKR